MEETLTFRPGRPIVIATPMGLITIDRLKNQARKVRITLPEGLEACRGEKDALDRSKFIERRNGCITPKYSMLVPVLGMEGELLGIAEPDVVIL